LLNVRRTTALGRTRSTRDQQREQRHKVEDRTSSH
jgi:hypothetical protein